MASISTSVEAPSSIQWAAELTLGVVKISICYAALLMLIGAVVNFSELLVGGAAYLGLAALLTWIRLGVIRGSQAARNLLTAVGAAVIGIAFVAILAANEVLASFRLPLACIFAAILLLIWLPNSTRWFAQS